MVAATASRLESLGTDRVIRRTVEAAARIGARLEGVPDPRPLPEVHGADRADFRSEVRR